MSSGGWWRRVRVFFFFNDTATTEIYTLSLHDALPITYRRRHMRTLLCTAIVLAACAPGDGSRASTSAGPAHKYAGTWEGRSFRSASDTGTPWRIVTAVAPDGSLRGTLTYTSVTAPPVPI